MSSTAHPEALPHRRPLALPGWGITIIALFLLVAAVAAGVVIGQNTATRETAPVASTALPVSGLAGAEATAMVDDMFAAWSSGDGRETASYFAPDAVVHNDIGGYTLNGPEEIAARAADEGAGGVLLRRDTPVIDANGEFLSSGFNWAAGYGIITLRMDFQDRIAEMWVAGY